MKKIIYLFIVLTAGLYGCDRITETPHNVTSYNSDYLFDCTALPVVTLKVPLQQWDTLLTDFDLNPDNEEYIPVTFVFAKDNNTITLDSVGIRIRGNTSRRRPEGSTGEMHSRANANWHHAHFNVDFSEYHHDSTFCETDHMALKWFKDDPTYCREIYCYNLFRLFGVWTAPKASYVRLNIYVDGDSKPAYFGVYEMIEGVNDSYLKNRYEEGHFLSDNGYLWKASYGANLSPNTMTDNNMGVEDVSLDASQSKYYIYDLKTHKKKGLNTAREQLKNFVSDLNNLGDGSQALETFLNSRMDMDLFLKTYAVNVVVGMWDDYWVNMNNFYFYFDSDNKLYFIPYDYDNTLGTSGIVSNSGTQDMLHWGTLDGSERLLIAKIMSVEDFKTLYKDYIKALINPENDYFYVDKSQARIHYWYSLISNYVSNDTGEDMSIEDKPASWGNCSFYRLFSGNSDGGANGNANFFTTKAKSANF